MHPERVQDIFWKDNWLQENLKIESFIKKTEVLREWRQLYQDMSVWVVDVNIEIWEKGSITLHKKWWKNFDALEKRGFFSRILRKDIIVEGKKKGFSLKIYFMKFYRYIRSFWKYAVIIFSTMTLCLILLFWYLDKIFVETRVNAGYKKLIEVRQGALDYESLHQKINNARFDLLLADTFFMPFQIFPWEKIDSVQHIISWGRHLSHGLDDMLGLYKKIEAFTQQKSIEDIYFTQLFTNIAPELKDIESSLLKSLSHYESISWLPNEELELQKQESIIKIHQILSYITTLNDNYGSFLNLLWHTEKKRYLVVFQNADEIRPTWGFMGSMWLLEIFKWKVQLFQKKDVYAIEWDLKSAEYDRLDPPKGINELTETFGLRDANYYANLKDSSNTIKFFTDQAGIDIDGIVYINQNILLRLLNITWPVYFDDLWESITSSNFSEIMSLAVESKIFQEGTLGTPKQVLFDFMEIFSRELISQWKYFDYLQAFIHDVESRDIMLWSFQEDENSLLSNFKLNGKINYDESLDFVYPVFTSLSGNKSDRYMRRSFSHSVSSGEKCSFNVELKIKSTHALTQKSQTNLENIIDRYKLDSPNLLEIQGASRNRQFVRVILPTDAIIFPSDDFEIVQYWSRQWVEFFINTPLRQSSEFRFDYILENPECVPYDFIFYKQPWIREYDIDIAINNDKKSYKGKAEDFFFELRK